MADTDLLKDRLAAALFDRVSDEAAERGVRLVVGSNITPEVPAYDAAAQGSILDFLGIRPYARVETKDGAVIASYGETQPIEWIRAAAYWGLVAVGIAALVKGFIKR